MDAYELFSLYGFSIEYPITWEIELNPKADRTSGDVVFKTQHHRVFLSWGSLEHVKKKFGSLDGQTEDGIQKVRKGADVRKLETLEHKEIDLNGHRAILNRFRVTLGVSFYAMRTAYRELSLVHFHCEQAGRFYVLYESLMGSEIMEKSIDTFQHMRNSFKCHVNHDTF